MRKVKFVDLGQHYLGLRHQILSIFDQISISGEYILSEELNIFEKNFAKYCGTSFAIGVGNGSDALMLPLIAYGIGPNDEVITAPNSFLASAWVIAQTGAKIVFCDVGEDMNIDPRKIEAVITSRTKAILPVHLTGRICDMESIIHIAQNYGLKVIEDAAQAVGARRNGTRAGAFGDVAGFSLHPLKNLHVHGDGGVITTNDEKLALRLRMLRNHGLKDRDTCEFWGLNSRLDAVHAAIANLKLTYLDGWNERNREIANIYRNELNGIVRVPMDDEGEEPIYHRFMIRTNKRDALKIFLDSRGVETKINYPIPLHLQPAAINLNYKIGDFPVAEELSNSILSLPLYPELSNNDIIYVSEQIKLFFKTQ